MDALALNELCAAIEAGASLWTVLGGRDKSAELETVKRDHREQIAAAMKRRLINHLVRVGWTDKEFEQWQLR